MMNIVRGLKSGHKSHSEYESVEDNKDLRIPVQNEDAFKHGIVFKAKYIGTQEITRPSSRVEIVSAMRRIRYEYKYRNIKKRKVNVEISVSGIKVSLWKKKKLIQEGRYRDSQLFVMCYPINRVFYVSHDSQDLLIFSYIARGDDGLFRCSVFKSFRKAQAMGIVRTIGQAFEVCHRINHGKVDADDTESEAATDAEEYATAQNEGDNENDLGDVGETDIDDESSPMAEQANAAHSTVVTDLDKAGEGAQPNVVKMPINLLNGDAGSQRIGNTTLAQVQQIFNQQLTHQTREAEVAKAEANLLRQQLRIESESRVNTQARLQQLLTQNRELLVTVQKLMIQLQNAPVKDLFDPINESWMTSSFPVTDSYFPTISEPIAPLKNNITNDCLSSVYDNQHHLSMDFGSTAINFDPLSSVNQIQPSNQEDLNVSFSDLRKIDNVKSHQHETESSASSLDAQKLSNGTKEGQGGLSTSFSDLRKVGTNHEEADLNHNKSRITKFSANKELDTVDILKAKPDTFPTDIKKDNSGISKEMMETFSEEMNDMKVLLPDEKEKPVH